MLSDAAYGYNYYDLRTLVAGFGGPLGGNGYLRFEAIGGFDYLYYYCY